MHTADVARLLRKVGGVPGRLPMGERGAFVALSLYYKLQFANKRL